MLTNLHHTPRLFGVPVFTLAVVFTFVAAVAALRYGISRWRQTSGKIAVIASACILVLYALAAALVIVTVASGSMG